MKIFLNYIKKLFKNMTNYVKGFNYIIKILYINQECIHVIFRVLKIK